MHHTGVQVGDEVTATTINTDMVLAHFSRALLHFLRTVMGRLGICK